MKSRSICIALAVCVIIAALVWWLRSDGVMIGRGMDIETYVRNNISEISPEKEVLGGTFRVINIETYQGEGIVEYEDGHNAYMADFTYTMDENNGGITITSFKIRQ